MPTGSIEGIATNATEIELVTTLVFESSIDYCTLALRCTLHAGMDGGFGVSAESAGVVAARRRLSSVTIPMSAANDAMRGCVRANRVKRTGNAVDSNTTSLQPCTETTAQQAYRGGATLKKVVTFFYRVLERYMRAVHVSHCCRPEARAPPAPPFATRAPGEHLPGTSTSAFSATGLEAPAAAAVAATQYALRNQPHG